MLPIAIFDFGADSDLRIGWGLSICQEDDDSATLDLTAATSYLVGVIRFADDGEPCAIIVGLDKHTGLDATTTEAALARARDPRTGASFMVLRRGVADAIAPYDGPKIEAGMSCGECAVVHLAPLALLREKYPDSFFHASMIIAGIARKLWPEFASTPLGVAMLRHMPAGSFSLFDMTNATEA